MTIIETDCLFLQGFLQADGTIAQTQQIAHHESPRTTRLYARLRGAISLDEIERNASLKRSPMLTIRPEEVGFSAERLERIPTVMQRFVDRGDLAGTLTLLARHGQVFHCATTGLMDIEGRRPMQADAIFRIYSMTKPVTVTAVLMLLEEGLLLLDDPGELATNPGYSMGLGVGVMTDLSQGSRRGSLGSFGWGGAAGTRFWVDPQEDMLGILLAQTMPGFRRAPDMLESLAYAALMD